MFTIGLQVISTVYIISLIIFFNKDVGFDYLTLYFIGIAISAMITTTVKWYKRKKA